VQPRRRRRGHVGLWMVITNTLVFLLLVYGVLSLTERPVPMPNWVATRIEQEFGAALAPASVEVARVEMLIGRDGVPRVRLRDLTLRDRGGAEVARLNDLSARLAPAALLARQLAPADVTLSGAQITVRRAADGRFAVSLGEAAAAGESASVSSMLARLDTVFSNGALAGMSEVTAEDITIALEDARSGRIWQASNASLALSRGDDGLGLVVVSEVFNGTDALANVQLSFRAEPDGGASIGAQVGGMPAEDIALQSPALSFLNLVSAPIDGSMRAVFDAEGRLSQFAASLEIGAGALQPAENTVFEVSGGRVYLSYDPAGQRITFSEISLTSEALTLVADGHAYLRDTDAGWPERLVGQFRLLSAEIARREVLSEAVRFDGGAADFNLRLDPFEIDIGQIVLTRDAEGQRADSRRDLRARGTVAAGPDGWHAAIDASAAYVTPAEILVLWPVTAIPNTRRWIAENVQGGEIVGVTAALRMDPGTPLRSSVRYDFRDAEVRFLKHFPPITGGQGRAVFEGTSYTMVLNRGVVTAPGGDTIELAGSVFTVLDVAKNPARADIVLRTAGPLRAGLELLDNKPFEILRKSGFDPGLVSADGTATSRISFELLKHVPKEEVEFRTSGVLTDVRLENLSGNLGTIVAERLELSVNPDLLAVTGEARLGDVPVSGRWSQPLSSDAAGRSRIEATVTMSPETLAALGVRLDGVNVSGAADAKLNIELPRDAPASFSLTSDLAGLSIGLPGTGWSKARGTAGAFEIAGQIGPALSVDTLAIEAPGLAASGRLTVGPDGAVTGVDFDRVRVGGWLDAPVTIRPASGGGAAEIAVLGGRIDLRTRPESGGGPSQGALSLALDELVISDTLSLRPFTARMPGGTRAGRFDARVNGGTEIGGDVFPRADGTAFRIRSDDGGGVLDDARILPGASGGAMLLSLVPDGGPGAFRGELRIEKTVLRDAPAAAMLLDSMSVVGLLENLESQGVHFDTIDVRFRIGNGLLRIDEAAAVGASLGVSLDGVYDLEGRRMDLQGVVSPLYLVNGIGSIFTRRGEGLFGVSFQMAGPAETPTVTVNPLSILTPGMFREIFRRAPPAEAAIQ